MKQWQFICHAICSGGRSCWKASLWSVHRKELMTFPLGSLKKTDEVTSSLVMSPIRLSAGRVPDESLLRRSHQSRRRP